ncbi:hypothetical protein C8D77_1033 [Mesorhizobium loti]|uniref:Uncharacterized protein n=1 Tax=Rhizobium loti TaxID=381 RepID=A0A8E2WCC2_RHILI|nr:hypothetical protein C8D77_1033 [Mesorhizobium loti]
MIARQRSLAPIGASIRDARAQLKGKPETE